MFQTNTLKYEDAALLGGAGYRLDGHAQNTEAYQNFIPGGYPVSKWVSHLETGGLEFSAADGCIG